VGTKGRIAPGLQHRLACLAGETPAESPVSTVPREKMDQVEAERPAEGLGASPCVAVITTVSATESSSCFDVTPLCLLPEQVQVAEKV
jgi:hypothetical protein